MLLCVGVVCVFYDCSNQDIYRVYDFTGDAAASRQEEWLQQQVPPLCSSIG